MNSGLEEVEAKMKASKHQNAKIAAGETQGLPDAVKDKRGWEDAFKVAGLEVEVHNLHTPPEGEEALKNKVKSQTERIAEIIAAKLNPTEAGTTTTA